MKPAKTNNRHINPFDLGSVARITQNPTKSTFGTARSSDVYSAGGKNSSNTERQVYKHKK